MSRQRVEQSRCLFAVIGTAVVLILFVASMEIVRSETARGTLILRGDPAPAATILHFLSRDV